MHTDLNAIDMSGIPTTLAIIGAITLLVLALRWFNRTFPQVAETFKDMTPWMEWTEKEPVDIMAPSLQHPNYRRWN
jgi:hypothetical protein